MPSCTRESSKKRLPSYILLHASEECSISLHTCTTPQWIMTYTSGKRQRLPFFTCGITTGGSNRDWFSATVHPCSPIGIIPPTSSLKPPSVTSTTPRLPLPAALPMLSPSAVQFSPSPIGFGGCVESKNPGLPAVDMNAVPFRCSSRVYCRRARGATPT